VNFSRIIFRGFVSLCVAASAADAANTAVSAGGVVVSGSSESTAAGLEILKKGGSAADAAVTVSLVLGMTEPFNSGLGGKLVALYYEAKTGKVSFIDAMSSAPLDIPVSKVPKMKASALDHGYPAACIPGCAAGLGMLHEKWGKLEWKKCVEPAADIAAKGYEVPEKQLVVFKDKISGVLPDKEATSIYYPGGKMPVPNQLLKNPDLAMTLRAMADQGAGAFYQGDIAEKMVKASKAGGGWFSMESFAKYEAKLTEPLSDDYKGYHVYTAPAPLTGGATMLLTLKILEGHDWKGASPVSFDRIDLTSRVFQQVYPVVKKVFADVPTAMPKAREIFRAPNYELLLSLATESNPKKPRFAPEAALDDDEIMSGNTTHFLVMDREGNIACVTQSLSHHFGAGVVPPGTGVLLNDDLTNFGFHSPGSVNQFAPGKRPRSTITPVIVTKDGKPVVALGAPASQRIPTGVHQVLTSILDFGLPLAKAIEEPRFHLRQPGSAREMPNKLDLESGIDADTVTKLSTGGWRTYAGGQDSYYFAGVNAVRVLPDGKHEAAGDDRRTNIAAGE